MPTKFFSFLLLPLLLSSCSNEYQEFHAKSELLQIQQQETAEQTASFTLKDIEDREVEILTTPDKKVLDRIISMLNSAKTRIQVETYILTEKRIIQALKDAHGRGVPVEVIIEKNVFWGTSINTKTYNSLRESGVPVNYANNKLYTYTHTKALLIDDTYIITTGNLSYASFSTNREFYAIGKNTEDLTVLRQILEADFRGESIVKSDSNLVISPVDSRTKIETLLENADREILMYAENFGDPRIEEILSRKASLKIPVRICMADPKKISSNTEVLKLLQSRGIDARYAKKPVMHAKVALIDNTYHYIGSENFTTNSLDNNREIGIVGKSSSGFVANFRKTFESDCGSPK